MSADTTGILQLASNNGTVAVTINTSQNVGIGTSSPATRLNLDGSNVAFRGQLTINGGSGGLAHLTLYNGPTTTTNLTGNLYSSTDNIGVHLNAYQPTGYIAFETNAFTEQMRIDSSGNVGVGTTSPATYGKFHVRGTAAVTTYGNVSASFSDGTTGSMFVQHTNLVVQLGSDCALAFGSGPSATERARIDSSGKVIFNATSESGTADSVVTIKATGGVSFARALALETHTAASVIVQTFRNPNGQVGYIATDGSATQYSTASDYRLKEAVQPMTGALAKVALLKPVNYKWKVDGSDGQGFIAHELAEVVPNCVFGEKDGTEVHPYEISPAVPATFDEEGKVLTPAVEAVMGEREVPKYQGIDTSFLVATLTAAIQELNAKVTSLEEQVLNLGVK
jgi:hypothetical protein